MFTRRLVLTAAASVFAFGATVAAHAADWKTQIPELTFALVPAENAAETNNRWQPMMDYLSKKLGVKVTLRIVNDYAAVIEGQKAGNIHIALYGPASYARAYKKVTLRIVNDYAAVIEGQKAGNIHIALYGPASYARAYKVGADVTPFAMEVVNGGIKGYHSVLYVKKDSPYKKLEDLKDKPVAFVDPNSTSGNNVPRFEMNKMGLDPDKFFSKVVYSGTHENSVLALQQGTVEAAFNAWDNENSSTLMKMQTKGIAKYDDYRIIFKSAQIVNSPIAYLNSLPEDAKAAIRDAFLNAYTNDRAAFFKAYDGKYQSYEATSHDAYKGVVELITFVDELKKKSS